VQVAEDLEIREPNAGKNYPPPEGDLAQIRFLGAGFPDYPWLFGTDGEYTAFASVGVGQFEPIKDHLRALRRVSLIDNGNSGKVVHEVVTDGAVFFGSNADAGNTDETAKFPSAVALIWRWTGDNNFRDEMYGFTKSNMEYIFRELDEDNDGWPEGLGNVERSGMGEEKLDNTVYTIRGLYDLADMARSKGDVKTAAWALKRTRTMESRFEAAWWFGQEGATQYADSIDPSPVGGDNTKIFQRHWIGATPMKAELVNVTGNGSVAVSANVTGAEYSTTVTPDVALRELLVGHTVPGNKEIVSVTLEGEPVDDYRVRRTNRGKEVLVKAATSGVQTLVVTTA
jgi:glycogen debranching enzyme